MTAAYVSGTVVGGFTGRVVAGLVAADVSWQTRSPRSARSILAAAVALWWLAARRTRGRAGAGASPGAGLARRAPPQPRLVATYAVGFGVLFTQVAMFTYVTFHARGAAVSA